eukprot:m.212865 g.212865  ORF g.212865 m.212865 type:complete len:244 (+) comp39778_c0_seq1:345-1076(+)
MAKALFDAAFPSILEESLPTSTSDDLALARDWLTKILEVNVPHGKKNRGLSVITSYQHLVQKRLLSEKETKQLHVLGWCTEILQACCLVADDIMDHSKTRRGQPCWFRRDEVGLIAVNDAFLMEGVVYKLLKKHFRAEPYYVDLLELFLETSHSTEVGQTFDLLTAPEGKRNFDQFTLARYKAIVKYKTSLYSFYLPVAIAMRVVGITESVDYEIAKNILLMMGEFFQIQDDYLDYGKGWHRH